MSSFSVLLAFLSILSASAAPLPNDPLFNDWSKPCNSGVCQYATGDGVNTAYAALSIKGSPTSVSDITQAGGWEILGCNPAWARGSQSVRIVCVNGNCQRLFDGGAENTIVRLPESCGRGPFARVNRVWVSEDQSVPQRLLRKRQLEEPVRGLQLDFNFGNADPAKGTVKFSMAVSNAQANNRVLTANRRVTSSRLQKKQEEEDSAEAGAEGLNDFGKSDQIEVTPVNFSKKITLLDEKLSCANVVPGLGIAAGVKVDVSAQMKATVVFGYNVAGTLVPPDLTEFSVSATAKGDASATFTVKANAQGDFNSDDIEIFTASLPGLSFPGVITIGPKFTVNVNMAAELGLNADLTATAAYKFPTVELKFPADSGDSAATITPGNAPLTMKADPTVTVNGQAVAHLIPRLDLGVEVFGGVGQASVFMLMDAAATLGIDARGSAELSNGAPAQTSFSGCVTLDTSVDVKGGAEGAIRPFFSRSTSFDIFSTQFDPIKRCVGDAQKRDVVPNRWRARAARRSLPAPKAVEKRALSCPSADAAPKLAPVL